MFFQPATVDYLKMHFEYPELTKVHERPAYETLKKIRDEIKANAARVPTTLGGGAHGHLGLILTPAEYALISPIPYVRPGAPGTLNRQGPATAPAGHDKPL